VLPSTAAADATTIPDSAIPDASLRSWIKTTLKVAADQEIPLETAEARPTLTGGSIQAPIADLTGLEYFTNLTTLNVPAYSKGPNTYASLAPIAGMSKLTSLTLSSAGGLSDLSPLSGVTSLTSISVEGSQVTDFSPLAGSAPTLTSLSFRNGKLPDLS